MSEGTLAEKLRRVADLIESGEVPAARFVLVTSAEVDGAVGTCAFSAGCRNFIEALGMLEDAKLRSQTDGFHEC